MRNVEEARARCGLYGQVLNDGKRSGTTETHELAHANSSTHPCGMSIMPTAHIVLEIVQILHLVYLTHCMHREIEMIHRATQWARDLDKDVLYLPHRVGGKLHVLKIENGFAGAGLDECERRGGLRTLEEDGKVLSVDFFIKGDHARYARTSSVPYEVKDVFYFDTHCSCLNSLWAHTNPRRRNNEHI